MARKNPSFEFTITIPKIEVRIELILKEHEMSHNKTGKILLSLTSKNVFWKNMEKQIEEVVSICDVCIRHDKIKLQDGLPHSKDGYCAMLTVVEYLTKFAWAFPLKHKSAFYDFNQEISYI